jgi:O-antigen/teichoic acid export membrane protein
VRPRFLQLLSDTAFYSAGQILRRGITVVTLPVFARYLTMSQLGMLAVIGTIRELLTVVFQLGLPNSADRFYFDCRSERERRHLLSTLFLFLMVSSLIGCAVLMGVGSVLWPLVAPDIPFHPYVSLTLVTVFLSGMGILPRSLFRVTNRVPLFTGLSAAQGVLTATLSIAFVVVWELGILGSVLGNLVTAAVFFVVFYAYLRKHMGWEFSWPLIRRALAFGLPDVPVRVGTWALKLSDRIVLQRFLPLSVVGLYSVGYTLGSTSFDLIATATASAILPFVYRTAAEESEQTSKAMFATVAAYNTALFAFLGLGTILLAREIIVLFTTAEYLGAEAIVPFVVWASIFQTLSSVPARGIYLVKRTGTLPAVVLAPAALNIGLNFVLIPRYGMMGAAWSTLLAYPLLLVLMWWIAQRVYFIPYDYRRIAKPLAIAFGLSLFKDLIPTESLLVALALKTLVLATFPILLLAWGFVTAPERRAISRQVFRLEQTRVALAERR